MKSVFFLISLFFLVSVQSFAITLEEFIGNISPVHPGYERERNQERVASYAYQATEAGDDLSLSFSPYFNTEEPVRSSSFSMTELTAYGLSSEVHKVFWNTGTVVSLGLSAYNTDFAIPVAGSFKYHTNELNLSVVQPVMKNRGDVAFKLERDIAEDNLKKAGFTKEENLENFHLGFVQLYLDWALLEETVKITDEQVILAKKQLSQAKRKFKDNLVDKVDVFRAEDAVNRSRLANLSAISNRDAIRSEIAVLAMRKSLLQDVPDYDLYKINKIDPQARQVRVDKLRVMKILKLSKKQSKRSLSFYQNQLLPQVDFILKGALRNSGSNISTAFDADLLKDYFVGLQVAMPLGNEYAKNKAQESKANDAYLSNMINQTILELYAAISSLERRLQGLEDIIQLNKTQLTIAAQKTKAEMKLYEQGRSQLNVVIMAQDSERNLKLQAAANAAEHHKLRLTYMALLDQPL